MKAVSIRGRQIAAPNQRTVSFYFSENGQRHHRTLTVGRPTTFEEVIVAIVDDESAMPTDTAAWPTSVRGLARSVLRRTRKVHASLSAPLRDPLPMYDVRAIEPNNMAQLLLEILPLCLLAQETLGGELKCVFREVHGPFRDLLDILDIRWFSTTRRLAGDLVRIRGTRGFAAYDLLSTFDCPSITLLPQVYERFIFERSAPLDRIFLARRGARSLKNQSEVEGILSRHGYETVFMEDYPVRDQLALAAQAKHVVAIHGAAMGLLIMNRGLRSLIELLPPHVFHQYFATCLDRRVDRYMLLMPEYDEAVQHSGWPALQAYKDAPYAVDLHSLELALEEASG